MVLEKLEKRVIIDCTLETLTTLLIGSGREDEVRGISLTFLKLPDGRVFIPGSSLKGVIRSEVEKILAGLGFDLCVIRSRGVPRYDECGKDERVCCASCAIFGSLNIASRVLFRDALPINRVVTFIKPGIKIHREKKTAVGGALFKTEMVPPNSRFNFEVVFENPEDWMLGVFFSALESILAVGGSSTRGAGKVKIRVNKITILTPESIVGKAAPEELTNERLSTFINECKEKFVKELETLKENYRPPQGRQ